MAMRFCIDALRASTALLPDVSNHHRCEGRADQAEGRALQLALRSSCSRKENGAAGQD
jgi:hypothetical protein